MRAEVTLMGLFEVNQWKNLGDFAKEKNWEKYGFGRFLKFYSGFRGIYSGWMMGGLSMIVGPS